MTCDPTDFLVLVCARKPGSFLSKRRVASSSKLRRMDELGGDEEEQKRFIKVNYMYIIYRAIDLKMFKIFQGTSDTFGKGVF